MAIINGSNAADTISGTGGNDTINGLDGPDTINGGGGDDVIYGHSLADASPGTGTINATLVVSGLSSTVFMTSAPGDPDHLYIVEKDSGRIVLVDPASSVQSTFLDIPDAELADGSEEGLLGLAFHPDYEANGRFFVHLVNSDGDVEVREYARSAGDPDLADPASAVSVITIAHPGHTNHNGGSVSFSPNDGFLYISVGDGGGSGDPGENAQDINSLLGKILRIDVNGDDFPADDTANYAIPASNPFVGGNGAGEIWAYGLRNPYRMGFDTANGDLYIGDVGQRSREEIDFQAGDSAGGENYGWDVLEGTVEFEPSDPGEPQPDDPSLIAPVFEYDRDFGRSVIGGYVYRGPEPGLQGAYIFADFFSNNVWSLRMVDGVATDVVERSGQIVTGNGSISSIASFGLDGRNNLYAVSISGDIYRLNPGAAAGDSGDILSGNAGADMLFGGIGDDMLFGGTGNDLLNGGAGADTLNGQSGIDTVSYDTSAAGVTVDLSSNSVSGGDADGDIISNFANAIGSGFDDTLTGDGGVNTLTGGGGGDRLFGGNGDDVLNGGAGNDRLFGENDADLLNGNAGVDYLSGGAGDDVVNGGQHNDTVRGNNGSDDLRGGDGDDLLQGGVGNDTSRGGNGKDRLISGDDDDVLLGGHDNDRLFGERGNDTLHGNQGNDVLSGAKGTDTLNGGRGNDNLRGNDGADRLRGGDDDDVLDGGNGFDELNGGTGDDTLSGGALTDEFLFNIANWGNDTITDFADGAEFMDMRGSGTSAGQLSVGSSGGDATVDFGGVNTITLTGMAGLIDQTDFIF